MYCAKQPATNAPARLNAIRPTIKTTATIMVVLALAAIFVISTLATSTAAIELDNGIVIPLVAAYESESGEAGVLMDATILVTDGSGHVFVDTNPYAQVDLQGSSRLASLVASDVVGVEQNKYDFYYIINMGTPIIGGPSAGGPLTVATIAALNNWTLYPDVVMTGMINPDGSIGPVGGIPYKLEAVKDAGKTVFLIPEGQTEISISKIEMRQRDNLTYHVEVPYVFNITEMGDELGITVKEVATIEDAVYEFTGHRIVLQKSNGTVRSQEYIEILKPLASTTMGNAKIEYEALKTKYPNNTILDHQRDSLNETSARYNEEMYYAATSIAFNSMIYLQYVNWSEQYEVLETEDQRTDFIHAINTEVTAQINASEDDVKAFKRHGINDMEVLGAAESRLTAARWLYMDGLDSEDTSDYLMQMAFAKMRADTVGWWLTLANDNATTMNEDFLKERSEWYFNQANSIHTYSKSVLLEGGARSSLIGLLSEAEENLVRAKYEIRNGYYAGAIVDSIHASVQSSAAIELFGVPDENKKLNRSRDAAQTAILNARDGGVEPTFAVSIYEFAQTVNDTQRSVVEYNHAKMIARTSLLLNTRTPAAKNKLYVEMPDGEIISILPDYLPAVPKSIHNNGFGLPATLFALFIFFGVSIIFVLFISIRKR